MTSIQRQAYFKAYYREKRMALKNGTWKTSYGMSQAKMDEIAGKNKPVYFGNKNEPYFTEKEMIEGFQLGTLQGWELERLNEIIITDYIYSEIETLKL